MQHAYHANPMSAHSFHKQAKYFVYVWNETFKLFLTHCDLVIPYGDIGLGQWLK